jgi:hypothetical protein
VRLFARPKRKKAPFRRPALGRESALSIRKFARRAALYCGYAKHAYTFPYRQRVLAEAVQGSVEKYNLFAGATTVVSAVLARGVVQGHVPQAS